MNREDLVLDYKNSILDVSDTPIFDEEKMTDIILQIGGNVKRYRTRQGFQSFELADVANISRPYMYKIESGVVEDFKVSTLIKLALALNVSIEDLVSMECKSDKKESLGQKIDILTQGCDIVTKNMILKSARSMMDLSKLLSKRGIK